MSPEHRLRELEGLLLQLYESEIAIGFKSPVLYDEGALRRLSWPRQPRGSRAFSWRGFGTVPEYRRLLRSDEYSTLLYDGAMLQLSWLYDRGKICGHRLCYVPCPIDLDAGDLGGETLEDYFDLMLDEELARSSSLTMLADWDGDGDCPSILRLRGQVRFDYAPESGGVGHPACHLTVGRAGVRVPVRGPLSLGDFIQFVFEHFYQEAWQNHAFLRRQRYEFLPGSLSETEAQQLHMHWLASA